MTKKQMKKIFLKCLIRHNGNHREALIAANEKGVNAAATHVEQDAWFLALAEYQLNFGEIS
jgi:adenosine/AMP kinase